MEQEDYIKRQIDQLGRVLGKMLAGLTGLKTGGLAGDGIETAGRALKDELDLDIDDLVSIPADELVKILQTRRNMNSDNFEKLADILLLLAGEFENKMTSNPEKLKLYKSSLAILRHVDETSSTYSLDRHEKIMKIKKML
jgi:hypothetical protein